jgi:hypothetical protein
MGETLEGRAEISGYTSGLGRGRTEISGGMSGLEGVGGGWRFVATRTHSCARTPTHPPTHPLAHTHALRSKRTRSPAWKPTLVAHSTCMCVCVRVCVCVKLVVSLYEYIFYVLNFCFDFQSIIVVFLFIRCKFRMAL